MSSTAAVELETTPRRRLHALTSLRFFAALFVVLHHALGPDRPGGIRSGYLGVTFFFVLSGFVLAWSYQDAMRNLDFWRNRAARILPLYWLFIVAGTVLPLAADRSPASVGSALLLVQAWNPSHSIREGVHTAAWSLSAELFFYACFPFAVALLRRLRTYTLLALAVGTWLALGAVAVRLPRVTSQAYFLTYNFPPYRFGEFLVGVCLALAIRRGWRPPVHRAVLLVAALAVGTGVLVADAGHHLDRSRAAFLAVAAVSGLIVWAVEAEAAGGARLLRTRPLILLGEWSYALYLVHPLVIRVVAHLHGTDFPGYLPVPLAVLAIAVSLVLAGVACELIEKPAERRLRAPRRQRPPAESDLRPAREENRAPATAP